MEGYGHGLIWSTIPVFFRQDWQKPWSVLFNDVVYYYDYIASVTDEWAWSRVEWYWQRRTEVGGEKPVTVCNLSHHKYHMHWPRIEPGLLRWQSGKTHTDWVTAEPEIHERTGQVQPRMQLRNGPVASNVPITSLSAWANTFVRCSVSNRPWRFTRGTVPDLFHSRRIRIREVNAFV